MNVNTFITWKSVSPSLVCCLRFNPVSRLSPRPLPFHNDEKCERGRGRPLDLAWRNQARGLREEFPLSGWSEQQPPPPQRTHTMEDVFFFLLKTIYFHCRQQSRSFLSDPALARTLPTRNTPHFLSQKYNGLHVLLNVSIHTYPPKRNQCAWEAVMVKNKIIKVRHNHLNVWMQNLRTKTPKSSRFSPKLFTITERYVTLV